MGLMWRPIVAKAHIVSGSQKKAHKNLELKPIQILTWPILSFLSRVRPPKLSDSSVPIRYSFAAVPTGRAAAPSSSGPLPAICTHQVCPLLLSLHCCAKRSTSNPNLSVFYPQKKKTYPYSDLTQSQQLAS